MIASQIILLFKSELVLLIFFFQAEDGIRDGRVTGVQTCALPISSIARTRRQAIDPSDRGAPGDDERPGRGVMPERSEERRVGKSVVVGGRSMIMKKK